MKRKARKDTTREKVVEVALALRTNKGFEKTTIADITKKANGAKEIFYNCFAKKEDGVVYLLEGNIAQSHEKFRVRAESTFIEQYEALICILFEIYFQK